MKEKVYFSGEKKGVRGQGEGHRGKGREGKKGIIKYIIIIIIKRSYRWLYLVYQSQGLVHGFVHKHGIDYKETSTQQDNHSFISLIRT